jgi:hypothetical protein
MIQSRRDKLPVALRDRYLSPEEAESLFLDGLAFAESHRSLTPLAPELLAEKRARLQIESRFEGLRRPAPRVMTFSAVAAAIRPGDDAQATEALGDRLASAWARVDTLDDDDAEWVAIAPPVGVTGDALDRAEETLASEAAAAEARLRSAGLEVAFEEYLRRELTPDEWDVWSQRRSCSLQALADLFGLTQSGVFRREATVVARAHAIWTAHFGDQEPPKLLARRPRHDGSQIANRDPHRNRGAQAQPNPDSTEPGFVALASRPRHS